MTNLKFELFINEKEPENEYQPKVGEQLARIFINDYNYEARINKDNYGEYINVPNYLSKRSHFFSDRIKDAVESIRNGDGDVISTYKVFMATITSVHYYLDREVGEKLREKSIEGFKDAEFQTCIKESSGCYLGKDDTVVILPLLLLDDFDELEHIRDKIHYFDSDGEAEKAISNIYLKTKNMVNRWNCGVETDFEELDNSIILRLIEDDETRKGKYIFRRSLKVVQEIKIKENEI